MRIDKFLEYIKESKKLSTNDIKDYLVDIQDLGIEININYSFLDLNKNRIDYNHVPDIKYLSMDIEFKSKWIENQVVDSFIESISVLSNRFKELKYDVKMNLSTFGFSIYMEKPKIIDDIITSANKLVTPISDYNIVDEKTLLSYHLDNSDDGLYLKLDFDVYHRTSKHSFVWDGKSNDEQNRLMNILSKEYNLPIIDKTEFKII